MPCSPFVGDYGEACARWAYLGVAGCSFAEYADQRRLDKAVQRVKQLPLKRSTEAEDRKWAEEQLAELMNEFKLSRGAALTLAKAHAPLLAQWCGGNI